MRKAYFDADGVCLRAGLNAVAPGDALIQANAPEGIPPNLLYFADANVHVGAEQAFHPQRIRIGETFRMPLPPNTVADVGADRHRGRVEFSADQPGIYSVQLRGAVYGTFSLFVDGYQELRRLEYPTVEEQLDIIYHEGLDGWKKRIKAVKDKHPKPQE